LTKLLFLHYFRFTKEFREKWNELQPSEWKRYNDLLKKHGLKMLNHGEPFGSEYHWVGIIESEKGIEAWEAFSHEYNAYGTSLGGARAETRTEVIRAQR
jgi:hypothetical protein